MREYRIIIGIGEDRNGLTILYTERNQALNQARRLLTDWFNGFTEYQHTGGWVNDQGELITERVVTFSVFARKRARVAADRIARLFNQQSVVIIYPNGDVEFIEPEYETQVDEPLADVLQGAYDEPLEDLLAYTDGRDTFSGH